jgi:hypothetical protein
MALSLLSTALAACQPVTNMPVSLRDEIESASRALLVSSDGPPPRAYSFVNVRCRADAALLITFEQTSGAPGMATAASTGDERSPWELKYPDVDPAAEAARFFEALPEVPCPS